MILLWNTTLSVEEIAALIGYSDHNNFYKAFRESFGKTAWDYLEKQSIME